MAQNLALYLTYEALKLSEVSSFNELFAIFCCTLPMRNWNTAFFLIFLIMFPPLYGCTLPMRNWNPIPTDTFSLLLSVLLLYLTYEELKPVPVSWYFPMLSESSLYLTYEELKHIISYICYCKRDMLYLTYEELKQATFLRYFRLY